MGPPGTGCQCQYTNFNMLGERQDEWVEKAVTAHGLELTTVELVEYIACYCLLEDLRFHGPRETSPATTWCASALGSPGLVPAVEAGLGGGGGCTWTSSPSPSSSPPSGTTTSPSSALTPPPCDWLALLSSFALFFSSFSRCLYSFSQRRSRRHSSKEAATDAPLLHSCWSCWWRRRRWRSWRRCSNFRNHHSHTCKTTSASLSRDVAPGIPPPPPPGRVIVVGLF